MPISMKRMNHTTPISHPGGVNQGFARVGYQVETDMFVKNEPIEPAAWQIIMHRTSSGNSLILMFSIISLPKTAIGLLPIL